jgi:hypothetical protein
MQNWVSLTVCNFAVLASAFFKLSSTTPDGTIYSTSGRRVGVVPPQKPLINFSSVRTHPDGSSGEGISRGTKLSKLDLTIDQELGSMSMAREKSPSPPPTTRHEG